MRRICEERRRKTCLGVGRKIIWIDIRCFRKLFSANPGLVLRFDFTASIKRVPRPILSVSTNGRIFSPKLKLSVAVCFWVFVDVVSCRVVFWIAADVDVVLRLIDTNCEDEKKEEKVSQQSVLLIGSKGHDLPQSTLIVLGRSMRSHSGVPNEVLIPRLKMMLIGSLAIGRREI